MSDLDILLPDHPTTVSGVPIVVRELRFAQTLRISMLMAPIIDRLAELCGEGAIDSTQLDAALCEAPEAWLNFMSLATGQPAEWIESLSDTDGRCLQMLTLERNMRFFVQRLLLTLELRKQQAASSINSTALQDGMDKIPSNSPSGSPSARSSDSTLPSSGASAISAPT